MSDGPWIVIPNWHEYQHYRNRNPVWIKLYTELNSRDDWRQLTLAERGLLVSIWCEFARARGQLRLSDCTRRVARNARDSQYASLIRAGFIRLRASKPLALDRDRDIPYGMSKETETVGAPRGALPISQNGGGKKNLVAQLLAEIRDSNGRTETTLHDFERRLPEAAFASALESLRYRRARTDRSPLRSEARYVVQALATMEREGQYA